MKSNCIRALALLLALCLLSGHLVTGKNRRADL